jgi:hypothetical protein
VGVAVSVSRINNNGSKDLAIPYDIISMFLGFIWLWVFGSSAPFMARKCSIERISTFPSPASDLGHYTYETAMVSQPIPPVLQDPASSSGAPRGACLLVVLRRFR